MCKVRSLNALLMHPQITGIHCKVKARSTSTDHNHTALFYHECGHRDGRFAWVLKHHVDIITFTANVPDRFAKFTNFAEPFLVFIRVNSWQLTPAIKIFAIQNALSAQAQNKVTLSFI